MAFRLARVSLLITALLAVGGQPAAIANTGAPRRFIAMGPDSPTPAAFRAGLSEFEKLPFDGTLIEPRRQLADGSERPADAVFTREPWQPSEIDAMVAELKQAKPGRARDSFLALRAAPGDVDWFDDAGWRETVDHWRLMARSAKLGGLRGLAFDPAPGSGRGPLFYFPAQSQRLEKDFAAYAKIARDRGREVMLAVATEFPEAVILCPTLYSEFLPLLAGDSSPAALLPSHRLGLLPAFLDGWWDAATPKIQIVDGCRPVSRTATSEPDFLRTFASLRTQAPRLAAAEHRTKLRSQLLIGHGLILDDFLTQKSPNGKSAEPVQTSPEARLSNHANAALRASDGWIWIDGTAGRWWSTNAENTSPLWPDAFPGVTAALTRARTPAAAARARLTSASPAENRLANPDFSQEGREGLPELWWTWQRDDSRGTARRHPPVADANQPATASWSAATEAHFGQNIPVKPGESYAIGTRLKSTGHGVAWIKIGWKDTKGLWTAEDARITIPPDGAPDPDGWHDLAAIIKVPSGASQLVLMLGAQDQLTDADTVRFARPMAVRL